MSWPAVLLVVYGVINVLGGIMGFAQAGSAMSLAVGAVVGLLLVSSGLATRKNPGLGFRSGGLLILALICFWAYRANAVMAQSKSVVLPLLNLVLGAAVLATLLIAHFVAVKRRDQRP